MMVSKLEQAARNQALCEGYLPDADNNGWPRWRYYVPRVLQIMVDLGPLSQADIDALKTEAYALSDEVMEFPTGKSHA